MKYSTKISGSKYSDSYKVYVTENDKIISPFHDINLYDGEYVRAVNEIPRFENAKFEISKNLPLNPIVQDVKKGQVRFVKNVYPFVGYQTNYGAIPQTWEDPETIDKSCEAYGDNDPLDCIEIGTRAKLPGEVYSAKVLGCLALLDDNEADWKIVLIDSKDENANKLNDISDVDSVYPNLLDNVRIWFRDYKKPDGKPENNFALGGKYMDAEFAKNIIKEANESWKKLMKNGYKDISIIKGSEESLKIDESICKDSEKPNYLNEYSFVTNK